jgi:hypothetical protein
MNRTRSALLQFVPELNKLSKGKELRHGLSAVVQIGDTLWVANDETISLERLSRQKVSADGAHKYGEHKQFALNDYLRLPVLPPSDPKDIEEVDVEGLDYENGYLWLVGSHSLKRNKPDKEDSIERNLKRLARVTKDGNRFLLARIPLVEKGGTYILEKEVEQDSKKLTAAQLRGNDKGNDLTKALTQDEHLQPFLAIPGKDNGFDIEGLAVAGDRLFIGLRGPVLRGWATILEVELKEDNDDPFTLELKKIGPNEQPYRKHFLDLGGLGIRDLCVRGSNLLILAGPSMDLDGPVTIFQWLGGAQPNGESFVSSSKIQLLGDIPFGQGEDKGKDHAEGMTLFSPDGSDAHSVLVVYDSASDSRLTETNALKADIFPLPG